MKSVIVLLAVIGVILAEALLPYHYEPSQTQQEVNYDHKQLNGFRPSHGYPCPDGIVHHNTQGRITKQHFEMSGEPILPQPLPPTVHSDNQVTGNSQIAFGGNSHGEFTYSSSRGYTPPQLPVSPKQYYTPQPLPLQHHQANFQGSVVQGVGKAPPPFALNQHQHHHHYNHQQVPVQQHRPMLPIPHLPNIRPQSPYIPPRQDLVYPQAHTTQAINVPASLIAGNLIPPHIVQTHSNFIEQNQLSSSATSGSFRPVNIGNAALGGSFESGILNTISTGSTVGSTLASSQEYGQSGSTDSSGSSSGSLGFTSIGSTHNFNHPGLDEGLSQVISETFANAGVGENVEKHIYVHVPPNDLEERGYQHVEQQSPVSQPKKHYKIIFIKAPNQQPSTNIYTQIAQQQATEEKTLVYVLVKKPDEPTIQDIQQIQSTYKPSKPEVYFIKYKTREDHEGVGHNSVDLTNGNFQGSDLNGIDIRGGFNGESNTIHDALASSLIEPRIPIGGNIPEPVYGPPEQH